MKKQIITSKDVVRAERAVKIAFTLVAVWVVTFAVYVTVIR